MQLMHGRASRLIYSVLVCSVLTLSSCGKTTADGLEVLPDDPGVELVPMPGTENVNDGESEAMPAPQPQPQVVVAPRATPRPTPKPAPSQQSATLSKYDHLDPQHLVPTKLLKEAVLYFDANASRFANKTYITVIDFSKRSSVRRMFVINMKSGAVWALTTAHGKGSDPDHDGYADKFSNVSGSNASSLGFYKVAETYIGKYGLSLRLDGLSSTNSNARPRAVVIHGANYVQDRVVVQGRSFGCPAIPMGYRDRLIPLIKGGSLLYIGLSGQK